MVFPPPGLTDQRHLFALPQGQVEPLQHMNVPLVGKPDVPEIDDGRRSGRDGAVCLVRLGEGIAGIQ